MMRPGSWLIHTCCRTRSISSFVILSSSSFDDSSLLVDSPELIPSEHFKPWSLRIRSRSLIHAQRQATYLPYCCGVLPPVCLASLRVGRYSFRWALVVDVLPSWAAASSDQTFGVALSDCQCCAQAHARIYSRTRTHARLATSKGWDVNIIGRLTAWCAPASTLGVWTCRGHSASCRQAAARRNSRSFGSARLTSPAGPQRGSAGG